MKQKRHSKILELIQAFDIGTQEELAERLKESGYQVTQATVSRDIKELHLSKKQIGVGQQKYDVRQGVDTQISDKYVRILKDSFISMEMAQNILVVKTVSGMAMAAAAALDAINLLEIVGCIAGDDTIMAAIGSVDDTMIVMEKLRKILG